VCERCNTYFGANLDHFIREPFYRGALAILFGMKFAYKKNDRDFSLGLRLACPGGPIAHRARAKFECRDGKCSLSLVTRGSTSESVFNVPEKLSTNDLEIIAINSLRNRIRRAIGKIAINYLSWILPQDVAPLLLSTELDRVRHFVRYGSHELMAAEIVEAKLY